jgi:uncharacterized protein
MHTHTLAQDALSVGGALQVLLASPPVLFFFLGAFAALAKSNLAVPKPVTKLLSLYLLWAIGFKGGVEISHSGLTGHAAWASLIGVGMACVVPVYVFFVLRRLVTGPNAAALAATYGSISAVTFMAASALLESKKIEYGGHMVAVMALMESPAIVIAVMLLRLTEKDQPTSTDSATRASHSSWPKLLHEAFLNGPVLLLLGSLLIGYVTRDAGYRMFKPLAGDLFNGVLVFFLLDLGILAARRWKDLHKAGPALILLGIAIPLVNAAAALLLCKLAGLPRGDTILMMVLCASGSYIAVPAAARLVLPQATPGLYIPMALAVTFPFNIAVGIPLYILVTAKL